MRTVTTRQLSDALRCIKTQGNVPDIEWQLQALLDPTTPLVLLPLETGGTVQEWLTTAYRAWPRFSGQVAYPVPFSGNGGARWAAENLPLWAPLERYGDDRRDLVAHLRVTIDRQRHRHVTWQQLSAALGAVDTTGQVQNGICWQVLDLLGCFDRTSSLPNGQAVDYWLFNVATQWPRYSGHYGYPVPHPTAFSPSSAFVQCPHWEGEYGDARRDLLTFYKREAARHA